MARELSPFSARRLLTQQLALPPRNQTRSRSRERTCDTREKERRPRDASPDRELKDAPPPRGRGRDRSPEPFKRPRPSSRDEKRDRSRDTRRERQGRRNQSTERKRSRSADRRRHRSRDRRRERSTEDRSSRRHGSHSGDWKRRDRDGDRDRDRDGDGDGDGDRHRHRHRDGDRHRHRDTDTDRDRDRHRHRDRSRHRPRNHRTRSASTSSSPPPKRRRRTPTRSASPRRRTKTPLPPQELSFRGLDNSHQPPSKYGGAPPSKEKPNFKPTGALALAANRVQGTNISLKYHEPPEARKPPPSQPWRIFVFKGNDVIDTLELWQKSCWLLGRSQHVVDYLLEHPSSSAQHAVIQFRYVHKTLEDDFGVRTTRGKVKPYIIDLESSNGTELNGEPIESSRYFELRDKDILTFAGSEREYVVMLPPPEAAT